MTTVKITAVGNSAGVLLSKDILAKLRVDKGDFYMLWRLPTGLN